MKARGHFFPPFKTTITYSSRSSKLLLHSSVYQSTGPYPCMAVKKSLLSTSVNQTRHRNSPTVQSKTPDPETINKVRVKAQNRSNKSASMGSVETLSVSVSFTNFASNLFIVAEKGCRLWKLEAHFLNLLEKQGGLPLAPPTSQRQTACKGSKAGQFLHSNASSSNQKPEMSTAPCQLDISSFFFGLQMANDVVARHPRWLVLKKFEHVNFLQIT